jgi:hypothetical protein
MAAVEEEAIVVMVVVVGVAVVKCGRKGRVLALQLTSGQLSKSNELSLAGGGRSTGARAGGMAAMGARTGGGCEWNWDCCGSVSVCVLYLSLWPGGLCDPRASPHHRAAELVTLATAHNLGELWGT